MGVNRVTRMRRGLRGLGLASLGVLLALVACSEDRAFKPTASPGAAAGLARNRAARPLTALSTDGIGGAMVGARLGGADGDRRLVLIADSDARVLRVVEVQDHDELLALPLRGAPAQVVVARDGRAYVSLRDVDEVVVLEVDDQSAFGLTQVGSVSIRGEPYGLATTPDGETLLVTSAWGGALTAVSLASREVMFAVDVAREPRAVAVSRDGEHAWVTHAAGPQVTQVALATRTAAAVALTGLDHAMGSIDPPKAKFLALEACAWGSTRRWSAELEGLLCASKTDPRSGILLGGAGIRAVAAHHGTDHVWDNLLRIRGYDEGIAMSDIATHARGAAQGFAITAVGDALLAPAVLTHLGPSGGGFYGLGTGMQPHEPVMIDMRPSAVTLRVEDVVHGPGETTIDRARRSWDCLLPRAAASDGRRVFIACVGTDRVLAYDGSDPRKALADAFEGRIAVPPGPTGLAVDREMGMLHVWSQFSQTLSSTPLAAFSARAETPGVPERASRLGDGARDRGRELFHASGDTRIAADGRACASCHPDGRDDMMTWPTPHGPRQTPMLSGRLGPENRPFGWQGSMPTVSKHLGETVKRLRGTGLPDEDVGLLVDYLRRLPVPAAVATEDARAARGKELFFSPSVGCSTCHREATASDGTRHDVGSGARLDTPSLRFVAGTAPYFHDGRYGTLRELLAATQGKMGWAEAPSEEDLDAIEAYLRTL
jgi:mono/diheme cytochrome c family protein